MKRNILFLATLCCVGLLATASPIQAQRGGGYHGGYGYGYGGVGFYGGIIRMAMGMIHSFTGRAISTLSTTGGGNSWGPGCHGPSLRHTTRWGT